MTGFDRLPAGAEEIFGAGATAQHTYDLLTVDVPAAGWIAALETARDRLGCTYFDWLSAVDEPETGFRVCSHLVALPERDSRMRHLLLRTSVPRSAAELPTATGVYAGAAWHERETHEMFGIAFAGHPNLVPLLLPEDFEGHPLRKDFVLAARVAKAWPGAKEPGEGHQGAAHDGPRRRQMLPPGVPDPHEWGPLKGQLPAAPARRPARAAAGERPARRTRSASEGSAGQRAAGPGEGRAARQAAADAPWQQAGDETGDEAGPPSRSGRSSGSDGAGRRRGADPDAPERRSGDGGAVGGAAGGPDGGSADGGSGDGSEGGRAG